jgi:hypothetical protein
MEHTQNTNGFNKRWIVIAGFLLAAVLIGLAVWRLTAAGNPAPDTIQSAGGSGVYQPDSTKLPAGYTFDNSAIRQADDGVSIVTISSGNGKSVSISQQAKPGSDVIDNFLKTYIPLHAALSTSLGQAQVGASGQSSSLQTIVSLPVKNGPWLIITAPADISQDDLKQIIESLKH